jgi:hypothetical protein
MHDAIAAEMVSMRVSGGLGRDKIGGVSMRTPFR